MSDPQIPIPWTFIKTSFSFLSGLDTSFIEISFGALTSIAFINFSYFRLSAAGANGGDSR